MPKMSIYYGLDSSGKKIFFRDFDQLVDGFKQLVQFWIDDRKYLLAYKSQWRQLGLYDEAEYLKRQFIGFAKAGYNTLLIIQVDPVTSRIININMDRFFIRKHLSIQ